jgi:spore coat protein U-like protein
MPLTRSTLVALVFLLLLPAQALGQSCTFGISDVDFGNPDLRSGGNVDTTATLSISCTGVPLTTVRICPSIGAGSGGATASARQMAGATASLNYQLYQDPTRSTVWGSYTWGFPDTPPTIDLPLGVSGAASTNRTIYARIFGGQGTAPGGSYVSTFAGAETSFVYATQLLVGCPNMLLSQTANPTFTVRATVVNDCSVVPQDIDFGSHGVLTSNIDASAQLLVNCVPGTAYTIGLNGGLAAAAPTARLMKKGAASITYGLYRDAARTQAWGDTIGTNTVAGTGIGSVQTYTVFGRVPPQAAPSAGIYADTVVVTVTY